MIKLDRLEHIMIGRMENILDAIYKNKSQYVSLDSSHNSNSVYDNVK